MKMIQGLFLLAAVSVAGCATMQVSDVASNPKEPGVRYSLPKPVLVVSPSAKGGGAVDVEIKYLPDDAHTYAIDADTFLAFHKLQVDVQNRLLTKVVWNPDTASVASDAIGAAGEVAKAQVEAEAKRAEAEAAAKEAQFKAVVDKLSKSTSTVAEKKLAVDKAEANLALVNVPGADPKDVQAARIKLAEANEEYEKALRDQGDVSQYISAILLSGAADNPKPSVEITKSWGPVMFALNEKLNENGNPELSLLAGTYMSPDTPTIKEKKQAKFSTTILPSQDNSSTPSTELPAIVKATPNCLNGLLDLTLDLNFEPQEVEQAQIKGIGPNTSTSNEIKGLSVKFDKPAKQLHVTASGIKPGEYQFVGKVRSSKGAMPVQTPFTVK